MDRITKSLLDTFVEEHDLAALPEDQQFEHFVAALLVGRHYFDTFDTASVVTGSGSDTGIDAVAVIVNGTLATDPETVVELSNSNGYVDATFVFIQAERSTSFDAAKLGQFGFGVYDFFNEAPTLPRNTEISAAAEVMKAVYSLSAKFKRGNPSCMLYYATTGRWLQDANVEARRIGVETDLKDTDLFRDVTVTPIDASRLRTLYQESKNTISRDISFVKRATIPPVPGVSEAYLGIIPATEFLKLISDDSGEIIRSIFYDNVRDWQDFNEVNSGMRHTLEEEGSRARFILMNNGVTVIAKSLRVTGDTIHIEDYQVVNGCQTSHVLWYQREKLDDSVMVPLRIIATEDEEVVSAIITATNRQTAVRPEQLLAMSDFQKALEQFFQSFEESQRLYYERRSRQFASTSIEKTRVITPGNLIRGYAAMFLGEPHRTTRSYGALLEGVGTTMFAEDDKLDPYYTAALAHYRLEYLFRRQTLSAKYKPAKYHVLLAYRILAEASAPPRRNSHEMVRYCAFMNEILWEPAQSEELFKLAVEVVESVAAGNFDRDHIRTQPFTTQLEAEAKSVRETMDATKGAAS